MRHQTLACPQLSVTAVLFQRSTTSTSTRIISVRVSFEPCIGITVSGAPFCCILRSCTPCTKGVFLGPAWRLKSGVHVDASPREMNISIKVDIGGVVRRLKSKLCRPYRVTVKTCSSLLWTTHRRSGLSIPSLYEGDGGLNYGVVRLFTMTQVVLPDTLERVAGRDIPFRHLCSRPHRNKGSN